MKTLLAPFLAVSLLFGAMPIHAQDASAPTPPPRKNEEPGYTTRDSTILSMMGWGLGLALGIALVCGYVSQDSK